MKKLMIAAAIVCAAAATYASTVNWSSTSVANFFDTADLDGNGSYGVDETKQMKKSGYTFAYTLTVTDSASKEVGSASGTVGYNIGGKFQNNNLTIGGTGAITSGNTYNYVIEITTDLAEVGTQGDWDYKNATAKTTLSGTFSGAASSAALSSGVPATWTVAGATLVEPTPEPTSAMLMLLGVAGLALKRKQK